MIYISALLKKYDCHFKLKFQNLRTDYKCANYINKKIFNLMRERERDRERREIIECGQKQKEVTFGNELERQEKNNSGTRI